MSRFAAWSMALAACVAVALFLEGRGAGTRADRPAAPPAPKTDAHPPGPPLDAPEGPAGDPDGFAASPTPEQFLSAEGPIRDRLLLVARVEQKRRLITAWKLGDELGESRDCLDEVLALLHGEQDPTVLHWLGEIIRGGRGALATLTDDEWARLAPVLLYGQPAERRRAVAGIHSAHIRTPPPEILDALRQCVRTERDPTVLAVAARGLLVLDAGWEGMGADLADAVGRVPAGALRREMTYVVQRHVGADVLEARFRAARDDAERNDWAHAIALAWSQLPSLDDSGERHPRGSAPDATRFAAVYRGVTDRDIRHDLLRSCPRDPALLRELLARETDMNCGLRLKNMLVALEEGR